MSNGFKIFLLVFLTYSSVVMLGNSIHNNDHKVYIISVGTPDYLDSIRKYNLDFPPDEQLDENVLVLQTVDKIEDVVRVLTQMDAGEVFPFLTEQNDID